MRRSPGMRVRFVSAAERRAPAPRPRAGPGAAAPAAAAPRRRRRPSRAEPRRRPRPRRRRPRRRPGRRRSARRRGAESAAGFGARAGARACRRRGGLRGRPPGHRFARSPHDGEGGRRRRRRSDPAAASRARRSRPRHRAVGTGAARGVPRPGREVLRARYDVRYDDGVFARDGYLAGPDERRLAELSRGAGRSRRARDRHGARRVRPAAPAAVHRHARALVQPPAPDRRLLGRNGAAGAGGARRRRVDPRSGRHPAREPGRATISARCSSGSRRPGRACCSTGWRR